MNKDYLLGIITGFLIAVLLSAFGIIKWIPTNIEKSRVEEFVIKEDVSQKIIDCKNKGGELFEFSFGSDGKSFKCSKKIIIK